MRIEEGVRSTAATGLRQVVLAERAQPRHDRPEPLPAAELRLWNAPQPAAVAVPARPQPEVTGRVADVAAVAPSRVPPDARVLALLAQDVYRDKAVPPAGWRVAGQAELAALGLDRSLLENSTTGFRARVYAEGSGADLRLAVSFRGSQTKGDWIANGQQALGVQSDHYRRAMLIGQRLARAEEVVVHITGHSLGGGLASACALASGRSATTFQAAGLSEASIAAAGRVRSAEGISVLPEVTAYHVRGEILSALQDGGDRVAGGLLGLWLGGVGGAIGGASRLDLPEAYGNRITLDAVRPEDVRWYQDNPLARHGMDWVLSSL